MKYESLSEVASTGAHIPTIFSTTETSHTGQNTDIGNADMQMKRTQCEMTNDGVIELNSLTMGL